MIKAETVKKLRECLKDSHLLNGKKLKARVAQIDLLLEDLEAPSPTDINGVTLHK